MSSMVWMAAGLLFCIGTIFFGGSLLTSLGDQIASSSRLGHHLMGMIFLAAVTSLPELAAGISAAGWSGQANLAYGEVLGSCVFNLAILGAADLLSRAPIIRGGGANASSSSATGIILLAVAALGVLASGAGGHLDLPLDLVIVGVYLVGMRTLRGEEPASGPAGAATAALRRRLWVRFGLAALLVIGPGLWLPVLAGQLAQEFLLSYSLVGTVLVGAVTSAPEAVVTYHCIRRGWGHMAVGNLLGSNLFNILVLVPMDAVYRGSSLYGAAGGEHAGTALAAIIMTGVVLLAGTWQKPGRAVPRWRAEGGVLLGLYLFAMASLAR